MPIQLVNDLDIGPNMMDEVVVGTIMTGPLEAGDRIAMPIDVST
jgi:hypothetical protein